MLNAGSCSGCLGLYWLTLAVILQAIARGINKAGLQVNAINCETADLEEMTELTSNLRADLLVPVEQADVHYRRSDPSVALACQQLGKVYCLFLKPELCLASGPGIKAAVVGEVSSVCVQTMDGEGKAYEKALEDLGQSTYLKRTRNLGILQGTHTVFT